MLFLNISKVIHRLPYFFTCLGYKIDLIIFFVSTVIYYINNYNALSDYDGILVKISRPILPED